MSTVPNHPIDPKHFEKNHKFRRFPGDKNPQPWLHPLPPPSIFDLMCREVRANVANLAYNTEVFKANIRKINTQYMGEDVYSFILHPSGEELPLG